MIGAITSGLGLAMGAAKFFEGRKMQREMQRAIENFEWDDLSNVNEGRQVSRLGADLRREELGRSTATSMDALRGGGARTIVGGAGKVVQQNNQVNREIGADLDKQQFSIDRDYAQDEARIRQMEETRQQQKLQGYGQMMSTGMGMKYQGMGDVLNAGFSLNQFGDQIFGEKYDNGLSEVSDTQTESPQGVRIPQGTLNAWSNPS